MPSLRVCCSSSTRSPPNPADRNRCWNGAFWWCLHTQVLPTEGHSSCPSTVSLLLPYSYSRTQFLLPHLLRHLEKSCLLRRLSLLEALDGIMSPSSAIKEAGSTDLVRRRVPYRSEGEESSSFQKYINKFSYLILTTTLQSPFLCYPFLEIIAVLRETE